MANAKEKQGNWLTDHWGAWALAGVVVAVMLHDQFEHINVPRGVVTNDDELQNRLAGIASKNRDLVAQNNELKLEKENLSKQLEETRTNLQKQIDELKNSRDERFDDPRRDYRDDWRDDYRRRPPYMDDRYGRRPAFYNPSREPYWYRAGGPTAYPVEYGRPQYGPYRYPWWDDRYGYGPQQQPYYGGGRYPQYPMGPRGGGMLRIGGSFNIGDNGRLNVGIGIPLGRRY